MKEFLTTNLKNMYEKKKNQAMLMLVGICLILCVIAGVIIYNYFKPNRVPPIPEIKASLEKIIEKNDLNTIQYPVNRAITVWDEDGKRKKYYVAYEANVTAGIDMSKVTITEKESKKEGEKPTLIVTLPEADYTKAIVDPESYDFLFLKQKYETETVLEEAARVCKEDLEDYTKEQENQLEIARENAVRYMKAFLLPFEESLKGKYIIEVQ